MVEIKFDGFFLPESSGEWKVSLYKLLHEKKKKKIGLDFHVEKIDCW